MNEAEGDGNLSPARIAWAARHLDQATRDTLAEDERWFLRQSLSTPCLNVAEHAAGSWLTDQHGRRILDFHGNSVHQVGYGHPRVVAAIKAQLDTLPFCPRRSPSRSPTSIFCTVRSRHRTGPPAEGQQLEQVGIGADQRIQHRSLSGDDRPRARADIP